MAGDFDSFSDLMTIDEVKAIGKGRKGICCVYCFFDGGTPVYIGKTVNSKRRFEPYKSASCHNFALNEFLKVNQGEKIVRILRLSPDDLDLTETKLIKTHFKSLFNISLNKIPDWKTQTKGSKPWIAGTGIKCPSQLIMARNPDKEMNKKLKSMINSMSDHQRCIFEINTMMDISNRDSANKWADIVSDKIINFLESNNEQQRSLGFT